MGNSLAKLNILHVTFNMGIGGTEQVITQLVENGDPQRFRQEVLCIDGEVGPMGQRLADQGIKVSMLRRRPGIDLRLARELRRRIREGDIHIVHCHQYTPYFYGWLAARMTRASVVFTEHGRFHPDRYRTRAKWLNRWMARTTAALVAISRATADALAEYEFMPRRRIQVIYNGIQGKTVTVEQTRSLAGELALPEGARVLCMVSRLDPIKNHSLALKAFQTLCDRFDNLVLVIVGDGPERAAIEKQVRELGLSERVRLAGYSASPEQYTALADLYLLTSYSEGTSMTLLEAMSLGVAPVATDVGGNPEIIEHGSSGCLVPNDDRPSLVEALAGLLEQPDQIDRLGQGARQAFAARFSVATMVGEYNRLYNRVAGTRP